MLFSSLLLKKRIVFSLLFISLHLSAEPWIDTSDIYLKANIQLLADTGYILTPVTTYPLMWHDISRDLKRIDQDELTPNQKDAYHYINHQLILMQHLLYEFLILLFLQSKFFL